MPIETAKILIVDDRPENLRAMELTLAPLGVEVISAASGNEALALMLRHDFALVLLDVQMPGMDGFETATLMQNNKTTRGVPIIFVTAINKDQQHVFRGYASGGVDYLFKPVDADILLSKVKVFINLHQARTECVRMQEELLRTRNLESLGFLAGGIAHDFNNILAALAGNVDLCLLKLDPSHEIYPLLAAAEKATVRAKGLTQQLLTFAKGGDPVKQLASVAEVITTSADFVLRGSSVACRYDLAADLWAVEMDTGQISQVIQNVVINAIQALPGGGTLDIVCRNVANADGSDPRLPRTDCVTISLHDSGPGIPLELQGKIFDPYFTTKPRGSGLGLAICHSIVTKHGGTIGVDSRPGQGATFVIALPAAAQAVLARGASSAAAEAGVGLVSKQVGRILIMDDDEQIREMAAAALTLFGHTVTQARDGEEAVALYRARRDGGEPFDLVLLDLTIPGGLGGKEAIARLQAIDPQVKGVVVSGYANDPVMSKCREHGFVAGISKPFQLQELKNLVATVLGGEERA